MLDTSTRLLRLLSTLQMRRAWTGPDLADRLEVTPRTLRRDIDRLRSLGYTIDATSGPAGGYQLSAGTALPPLLLDDDEIVAVTVALRSAADTFVGLGEKAIGVLVKLDQLLPARLRRRAGALQAVTVSIGAAPPRLDPTLLTTIAAACRDRRTLTFPYRDRGGRPSTRTVEPLRLAHTGDRLWYLMAWDLGREAWRTLRVDRIAGRVTAGEPFIPRKPPAEVEKYVADAISYSPFRYRARVKLAGSAADLAGRIPAWCGALEPLDDRSCLLSSGAESLEKLALRVLLCGMDFELIEPEELRPHLRKIAERLLRSAEGTATESM